MASADMKPGERKVVSEGGNGPVVEIIKRSVGAQLTDDGDVPEGDVE